MLIDSGKSLSSGKGTGIGNNITPFISWDLDDILDLIKMALVTAICSMSFLPGFYFTSFSFYILPVFFFYLLFHYLDREKYFKIVYEQRLLIIWHKRLDKKCSNIEDKNKDKGKRYEGFRQELESCGDKATALQVIRQKIERKHGLNFTPALYDELPEQNAIGVGSRSASSQQEATTVEFSSNITALVPAQSTSAGTSNVTEGKRKERSETASPDLDQKKPKFGNPSVLEPLDISKPGFFAYMSSLSWDEFSPILLILFLSIPFLVYLLVILRNKRGLPKKKIEK